MEIYRAEGVEIYRAYAKAAAEEHAIAHELAQCAKIDVYHLLASDLFIRVAAARSNTVAAFARLKEFESVL
ncbi:hypothetical protein GJV26_23180 [Massilia dura]|uniref:Uncharacterized protein n=1 Tax=Pseudoduganella dura TaxID=321982 RepID=A0A6I3XFW5_9BURK|nr:hypothetical protein [Pseudoduganella dura]MUI15337.1 hypothetical protein [Pseudoduganella dura]GGX80647.1 hypothetical protein GCM10007386_09600 [Pseudoduganella dura]